MCIRDRAEVGHRAAAGSGLRRHRRFHRPGGSGWPRLAEWARPWTAWTGRSGVVFPGPCLLYTSRCV